MTRLPVLTLSAAVRAMAALDVLHRVCLGMDAERQAERPTEDEYQAAMTEAAKALKNWTAEAAVDEIERLNAWIVANYN